MAGGRPGLAGVLTRIAAGVALAAATWNPSGWSFAGWAVDKAAANMPVAALAGVTLLILWTIYVRATLRSIGALGLALATAFVGALVWVLVDSGLLSLDSAAAVEWLAVASVGVVLGIGLSWSHVRRRLSGQVDVDDVDE
jgi:hypothetical protein